MAALGPDASKPSLLADASAGELGIRFVGNPLPKAFFAPTAEQVAPELIGCLLVKRHQLTITYPEGDAQQLYQALLLLKRSRCLNILAFCREAIAEKSEGLELPHHQEAVK